MSSDNHIFERSRLAVKKRRFQACFNKYDFLHQHGLKLISERLDDITHTFPNILYTGSTVSNDVLDQIKQKTKSELLCTMDCLPPYKAQSLPAIVGDEEFFPFANEKMDLIIANLNLHQTNDLPGSLIQIRRALKPDGLFIASLFGGETLWQLRDSLAYAEQKVMDGLSPRVHPFADKQQMGALMQRAGYALPVVDSELITVTFPNVFKLMTDLRGMGETSIIRKQNYATPPKNFFHEAGQYYAQNYVDDQGQLEATFEMIFLIGWAPADTQQKPMPPGSAEKSLAEALGTKEIKTGEKTGL